MNTYIERDLESILKKYLNKKEIIAVVGARQCGKTTLLQHLFKQLKNALFISFEDREKLALFDNDIDSFIEIYVKKYDYLFIDEFQYSKKGGEKLKYIFDSCKAKVIISGSSVSELSIQSIKYLVGRIFVFTLYPLSFFEFLKYKNSDLYSILKKKEELSGEIIQKTYKIYLEFMLYGGYPRVALSNSNEEKEIVLKNIYNTYILKEVKEIARIKEDYKLEKLIHSLALQIGSLANYNELSQITGFNYNEIISNLNLLKKTFVINESRPFFSNKRVELSKNPRFYFADNGFRNVIIRNFQDIKNRTDKGQLNENFVSSEIIKKNIELKHWRTKSKAEIDFVIENKGKIIPVEVKSDLTEPKLTKSIYSFVNKYKIKEVIVLSDKLSIEIKTDFGNAKFKPIFSIEKIIT